jgi:LysR family transcriptional regulator for bpeEF and oprC
MDLPAINAFVAVGDNGGFRSAASSLGMTSAGVSKAVARLEAQLGVTLVARTTRSVRLTSAGIAFHARCRSILADLELAGQEAADEAALPQGRLVVSMSRAFGRMRMLPILADYARLHPQVELELRLSDRVVDLVKDGVDVAIRIGRLPDSSLIAAPVDRTAFALCGSPEYLTARGVPGHPDELHHHDMIGHIAPDTAVRFTYRFIIDGAVRTMNLPSRLTLDDGEGLVAMGARSLGLVMANDYLMEPHLKDGSLVRVLRDYEMPPVPISAVYLPSRTPSPAIRALVDMLRRRFRALP